MTIGDELRTISDKYDANCIMKWEEENQSTITWLCNEMKKAAENGERSFTTTTHEFSDITKASKWKMWADRQNIALQVTGTGNYYTSIIGLHEIETEEYKLTFRW